MLNLAKTLRLRGVDAQWDHKAHRIRYIDLCVTYMISLSILQRCFAHIVNLACKAMLAELEILGDGVIARLRALVKMVRVT